MRYINHIGDVKTKKERPQADREQKTSAHQKTLEVVIQFIQENVIAREEVVELSSLRHLYVKELEEKGFPSPEYRSANLKTKLVKHEIGELIAFTKVNLEDKGNLALALVYSASISVADAVAHAYHMGSIDKHQEVALILRKAIQHAFKKTEPLPWPPTADDLANQADHADLPS